MIWWAIAGLILTVAAVSVFKVLGRPIYYRNREVEFVENLARTFASTAEGGVMFVEHNGSERFLQFRKAADTGLVEQSVVFGFPDVEWSRPYFDSVRAALRDGGFTIKERAADDAAGGVQFLEVFLNGNKGEIGHQARHLAEAVLPAIGLDDTARFTLYIEGAGDTAIWRRLNEHQLVALAESENHPLRRYARRELERAKKPRQNG